MKQSTSFRRCSSERAVWNTEIHLFVEESTAVRDMLSSWEPMIWTSRRETHLPTDLLNGGEANITLWYTECKVI